VKIVLEAIRQLMAPPETNKKKIGFMAKEKGQRIAAWILNTKERFLRQDIHDKRNFFGTFSFIRARNT